jgi:hypothetical protein
MNMMLLAIFASVGVGLLSARFAHRETVFVVAIATSLMSIYFFRPLYMT